MDQYDRTPGGTGAGGPANTPTFGEDAPALRTAADHQIPDATAPSHGAATGASAGGTATATGGATGTEPLPERASQMAGRAQEKLDQGMKQAAERIDTLAGRLDQVADERLTGAGARARAGDVAHSLADTMESVAGYLRSNDTDALRGDLERQMRERPLQTLMVAVAAGWLVGKIVR